ncbi:needs to be deleted [Sinorhizobium fredii NGR234]|uniref:Needs to be deleted n=1 Tax=Sinorhizobium fredii (strain NBRC 101917 / NGR234) TaxID=394 RepID=C3MAP7_SINFN|nr:needs to be deleted [Sinorhizobium fredii NGR234]
MIEGAAINVERRVRGVIADPDRAALVRRRSLVEGPGQNDREAGLFQHRLQPGYEIEVGLPVGAHPFEQDALAVDHDAAFRRRQVLAHRVEIDSAGRDLVEEPLGHGRHVGFQDCAGDTAEKLDIAERRPALAVGEIEIVEAEGLLIDGVVAVPGAERDHRARIVIHEIAADLVGAVGETGRVALVGRAQEQHGRLHGAGREDDELRRDAMLDPVLDIMHGGDRLAIRGCRQPGDARAGLQPHIRIFECSGQRGRFRIHLAVETVRMCIPGRLALGEPAVDIDAERQRIGVHTDRCQALANLGDRRLIRHRPVRIVVRMRWFGRVLAQPPTHLIEFLRLGVPRLELLVGKRPGGRDAFEVAHLLEVLAAVAGEHRAVEFRVAADIVVVAGVEAGAARLVPGLLRPEMAALEDRPLVAVDRQVLDVVTRLEDEDFGTRSGKSGSHGGAADARADDDDIRLALHALAHAIRIWLSGSKNTALSRLKASRDVWPGAMRASARSLATISLPPSRVTAKVSEPAGSTTSIRQSPSATNLALRSAPSGSVSASGRMPKTTSRPA